MSILKVNKIRHTGSDTDVIDIASDGTCSANLSNRQGRNLVVNGGMQCFQRASSFTLSGSDNNIYTADRFQHNVTSGASFAATHTISDDHPDGFSKSLLISPTATNTPTGGGNAGFRTKLEGQNLQSLAHGTSAAKKITLSFYAKSSSQNNGHQYSVQLRKFPSSDASSRPTVTRAFTVTTSWQRFSFTIIGDTSAVIRNDNLNGMEIVWNLASGPDDILSEYTTWTNDNGFRAVTGQSNFLDNTSNEFYITGVQLEVSDHATDFEHLSFADQLRRCQRYYVQYDSTDAVYSRFGIGISNATTQVSVRIEFPVPMRAVPTFSATATLAVSTGSAGYTVTSVALQTSTTTRNAGQVLASVSSGLTAHKPYYLESLNNNTSNVKFSAEL